MSFKEDPLSQSRPAPRALWLNRDNMEQARENWWRAFEELQQVDTLAARQRTGDQRVWDIAWAAAIAAHSYILEGRVEPR